jgi:saccharopine dehydrogenase-like NADP-dependent oxidoreductase
MPPFPVSRILVLGASGQFGRRLCRRLAQLGGFRLLLGGRDEHRLKVAQRQLRALKPDSPIDALTCDIAVADLPDLLRAQKINLVIHLAGPFQGQDYTVAEACLEAEAAYIDMADGGDFVAKFSTLDATAREKGVPLVTGASTLPAVSSAIIDGMLEDFSRLCGIDYGICAGVKSGLGLATLKAVLSYCGKPYSVVNDGKRVTTFGLVGRGIMLFHRRSIGAMLLAAIFPITICFRPATPHSGRWTSAAALTFRALGECCR